MQVTQTALIAPEGRASGSGTVNLSLPGVSYVSSATVALSANQCKYYPIYVHTPIVVDLMALEVTTPGAGGTTIRLGIYNADTDWQPTTLVVDAGTVAADAGVVVTKSVNVALAAGRYLLALNTDASVTLRSIRGICVTMIPVALGSNNIINFLRATQTYGAFPATGAAWTTAGAGVSPFEYPVYLRESTP